MGNTRKILYVVHSIDTEGPLYESISETFKRINRIYSLNLEASLSKLIEIQHESAREIPEDLRAEVARTFSRSNLNYIEDYLQLKGFLDKVCSTHFRHITRDSRGNGWKYTWHCVDHLDYIENPRRKDVGIHNIFDFYSDYIKGSEDEINWHYHPSQRNKISHLSSTNYLLDDKFFQIITRRIIDRNWFPTVNRAGYHTERSDSHWLLEQWIPFDLSNQSCLIDDEQPDVSGGRFGDWRRAPSDWLLYNPSHDDYQVPGDCRRYIGKCLNVGTRFRCINDAEISRAFMNAREYSKAVLAVTTHDFRDFEKPIEDFRRQLHEIGRGYEDVEIVYATATEAFRGYLGLSEDKIEGFFETSISFTPGGSLVRIKTSDNYRTFGPVPFLAIKTKDGQYYWDNLDIQKPFYEWTYVLDEQTFDIENIQTMKVASADNYGNFHVKQIL